MLKSLWFGYFFNFKRGTIGERRLPFILVTEVHFKHLQNRQYAPFSRWSILKSSGNSVHGAKPMIANSARNIELTQSIQDIINKSIQLYEYVNVYAL